MIEINGVAHIQITAGRYDIARAFYMKLLPFLGLRQVLDNEYGYYCVGGRTGDGRERDQQRQRCRRGSDDGCTADEGKAHGLGSLRMVRIARHDPANKKARRHSGPIQAKLGLLSLAASRRDAIFHAP